LLFIIHNNFIAKFHLDILIDLPGHSFKDLLPALSAPFHGPLDPQVLGGLYTYHIIK
jgi:hypothetical protein